MKSHVGTNWGKDKKLSSRHIRSFAVQSTINLLTINIVQDDKLISMRNSCHALIQSIDDKSPQCNTKLITIFNYLANSPKLTAEMSKFRDGRQIWQVYISSLKNV